MLLCNNKQQQVGYQQVRSLSIYQNSYNNNNILMQGNTLLGNTPKGASNNFQEQHHLQYQGFIFEMLIFSEQEISITFNQITESKIHEAKNLHLKNINYKTVLAGLRKEYEGVVKAQLSRAEDSYILVIEVKYEFIPKIEQVIKFTPRVVNDKEMSELEMKNYFHEIKNLKQNMIKISNCTADVAKYDGKTNKDYVIDIPKEKTLLTWSLQMKGTSNSVKLSILYFNSQKKLEKKTKMIPTDSISVYASSSEASAEMRFVLEPVNDWDQLIFRMDDRFQGKATFISQKL